MIERSSEVAGAVPLLARATPLIGHFQIRNRGTLGGSIAHADSAAEYPAVALTLDAELETLSPRGRRTISASQFFTGLWSTDLAADELLTGATFPRWRGRCGFAVEELARRHGDFAIAGAAVAVELDADALAPHNIRVNSVNPTQVNTPMLMNDYAFRMFRPDLENPTKDDFASASQMAHMLPVPWVEPVDISNAVLFLASDESRYITGVPLPIDLGAMLK